MDSIWKNIKEMFYQSKHEKVIFEGILEDGQQECKELRHLCDSVLASVVANCSGIYVDNWMRILGQGNEMRNGVLHYNTLFHDDSYLDGMLIIANDIVGGIYALNISRFEIEKNMIWYFAPDTLEWENLGMTYSQFLAWTAQGDMDEFYEAMRWDSWRDDCGQVEWNNGCLVYPFLWAAECNKNTAQKKIVPFDELMKLNFEYCEKLQS